MIEVTRLLNLWFAENQIDAEGFTLIMNFKDARDGARLDAALRRDLGKFQLQGPHGSQAFDPTVDFRLNGIRVKIESPVHQP